MHCLALHWLVLTLCDASDSVVLFKFYHFNHMCAGRGMQQADASTTMLHLVFLLEFAKLAFCGAFEP